MNKLVQINCVDFSSTGKITRAIGELAYSKGWNSWIGFSRGEGLDNSSRMIKIGFYLDILIHGLQTRLFDRHGLGSKSATKKLIRQIDYIKPDIIHLHNIHGYYINYEILFDYLKKINIPIVWTLHDCWSFTGHCTYFMRNDCEKWHEGCNHCTNLKEYPISYSDGSARNYAKKREAFTSVENRLTLVPVSEFIGNYLQYSFLRNCNYKVIRNGIDLNIFKPSDEKKEKSILAVANVWDNRKGFEDIIELRKLLPSDYNITVVGKIKGYSSKMPEGIRHIERTKDQNELAKLYSASSLLINPTYEDSLPTVNIEAIACGTPVITYRTGGAPETIDEKTGFVIDRGNIQEMASLIRNFKVSQQQSEDCRERAVGMFDQSQCFQKYIDLYNTLL